MHAVDRYRGTLDGGSISGLTADPGFLDGASIVVLVPVQVLRPIQDSWMERQLWFWSQCRCYDRFTVNTVFFQCDDMLLQ
jgi:hypothetical protein